MKDLEMVQLCVSKFFATLFLAITSLPGMYVISFSAIVAYLLPLESLLLLLTFLFIVDFVTGCTVSMKKYKKSTGIWSLRWFDSDKFGSTIIKAVFYFLFILSAIILNILIYKNKIHITFFREEPFTLAEIAVFVCMIREIWSILFENMKELGFDFLGQIENIATKGWKLYRSVKGEGGKDE